MNTGRKSIANWVGTFGTAALAAFGPTLASAQPQRYASAPTSQQPPNTATSAYPRSDCNLETRPHEGFAVRFEEGPNRDGKPIDTLIRRDGDNLSYTFVPHGDWTSVMEVKFQDFYDRSSSRPLKVFEYGKLNDNPQDINKMSGFLMKRLNLCRGRSTLGAAFLSPDLK